MTYTTFNNKIFDAKKEPMFFGQNVNVARYDEQKYPIFEKLIEKQLSFFWRPEEVDLTNDRKDFMDMDDHLKHIFLSNLKYQTLLDSVQGRSPNMAFLPLVSIPELETWFETWGFSETIHSRSYTHILRNVVSEPGVVFDNILNVPEIVDRSKSVTSHYDELIYLAAMYTQGNIKTKEQMEKIQDALYMGMFAANMLEGIRFYVSFACTFAFAEQSLMEGNAKIVKLIARDEALHMSGTQHMLNSFQNGLEGQEMKAAAKRCRARAMQMMNQVALEEKHWAKYLFHMGSMLGLNVSILSTFIDHLVTIRGRAIGFNVDNPIENTPLPWMNAWLVSDAVQVAPQEAEISSYLVGQIDNSIDDDDFKAFEL